MAQPRPPLAEASRDGPLPNPLVAMIPSLFPALRPCPSHSIEVPEWPTCSLLSHPRSRRQPPCASRLNCRHHFLEGSNGGFTFSQKVACSSPIFRFCKSPQPGAGAGGATQRPGPTSESDPGPALPEPHQPRLRPHRLAGVQLYPAPPISRSCDLTALKLRPPLTSSHPRVPSPAGGPQCHLPLASQVSWSAVRPARAQAVPTARRLFPA